MIIGAAAMISPRTLALCGVCVAALVAGQTVGSATCAAGPNAERFDLVEVAPGVLVHPGETAVMTAENAGGIANLGAVIGNAAIAVIDTGGSRLEGEHFRAAIRVRSELPIRYVILTHMHPDHVFGAAAFSRDDPVVVGHAKLPRALAARGDYYLQTNRARMGEDVLAGTAIVQPTLLVDHMTTIDLGGRTLVLTALPTAHTDNDLTALDTATGTLFTGDLVFLDHTPALDGSITGWMQVLDEMMAESQAVRAVPGHGPPSAPWPDAAEPTKAYLTAVADGVRNAISKGRPITEAAETVAWEEQARWALFEEFHPRNVTAAYAELEWE